jgi:GAF domain-containing protein
LPTADESADRRTELAADRTVLAAERTYASWVQLGLTLPDLNWAGFYLMRDGGLVLGPFQGNPACIRIAVGQGVCGTAVLRRESVVVPDVHAFPGHIACDSASRSELVVPLMRDGAVTGVLDLDSPSPGRFDEEDRRGCEAFAEILMRGSDPY